jgi:hypothetical protein
MLYAFLDHAPYFISNFSQILDLVLSGSRSLSVPDRRRRNIEMLDMKSSCELRPYINDLHEKCNQKVNGKKYPEPG